MITRYLTSSKTISVSVLLFAITIFVLSFTTGENEIWNIFALTETPEFNLNAQDISSDTKNVTKENNTSSSSPFISYSNATYGIKIDYPSDWTIKEGGAATIFHNQSKTLNVIAEILAPIQSDYYNPKIGASHNSIRLVVEDYDTFGDFTNNNILKYIEKNDSETNNNKNKLMTVATKRIGAIGIYCHNFDLKSWNQNTTLAGYPAHQIFLDYSYDKNSKDATEIWTIKDDKIYIIEFVAQDKYYALYLPVVNKIIDSFEISNSTGKD